jgi:hypothetical protein
MFKFNSKFKIKTSEGFKNFSGIQIVKKPKVSKLEFSDGSVLVCSDNHSILTSDGWKTVNKISSIDTAICEDKPLNILNISFENKEHIFYDIVGVENQQYCTNNIISHNCDFVGSENTLLAPSKLANLVFGTPITSTPDGLDIYEPPKKDGIYVMCVDTSRGDEQDYHAFSVIDCTASPYRQVAKFKNNTMSYQVFPHVIKKTGDMYNEALVLFELNDLGQAVAELLHEELEYGNVLSVTNRGKRGQKADGGFGSGKVQMGVRTSYQIKKIGCSNLKDMVENDKLIIQDFDTISEFSTYVAKGAGYEANEGYNDDLISTLVLFGWVTTQSYFKDYTNTDIRKKIYEEQIRKIEEQVMPFGFFNEEMDDDARDAAMLADDRTPQQREQDDNDLWRD